jgi:LacI family transcriptional regulator
LNCREFPPAILKHHDLPQAFIAESYHLSIGAVRALNEAGVRIPKDVSLVGIDKIPDYLTSGISLTCVRIPHTERARWAAKALLNEIQNPEADKIQIYVDCQLIPGDSVADRTGGKN